MESRTDGFRARTEERVTVPLTVHRSDGSGAAARRELARSHADAVLREGFDLSAPPLLKVAAFELERGRFTLVWTLHHVISDGWSWELLQHEFEMLYSSLRQGRFRPLPAPALPLRELVHRLAESPSPAPSPEWLTELRAVSPCPCRRAASAGTRTARTSTGPSRGRPTRHCGPWPRPPGVRPVPDISSPTPRLWAGCAASAPSRSASSPPAATPTSRTSNVPWPVSPAVCRCRSTSRAPPVNASTSARPPGRRPGPGLRRPRRTAGRTGTGGTRSRRRLRVPELPRRTGRAGAPASRSRRLLVARDRVRTARSRLPRGRRRGLPLPSRVRPRRGLRHLGGCARP
ncbi:hypothetical protein ID875_29210 [Streptomyces globisporus]|uniref:Condensation domain-containing protein n=1 Tax=Streptomyces globisporus TaxID=1908 RepID=A0A927BPG3_STRGL|nr:hypothetical protein [Streptomyces globisporus]